MITTTALYKTKIKDDTRKVSIKVEIFFDGDSSPATVLASDNVAVLKGLEEMQAEGDTPLGAVSSNECTLTLYNETHCFSPVYAAGPYYGKLAPNTKVVPYLGLETSADTFEWIKMGTFWTGQWDAPTNSLEATVGCYDKLYLIKEKEMPLIPTAENITRYQMFEILFYALGLTADEFTIDATLQNYTIALAYYPEGNVGEVLRYLAQAFNCTVFCTRDGVIKVLSNATLSASVSSWTDNDLIFSVNIPQNFERIYSDVCVKYSELFVAPEERVHTSTDILIPSTGMTLTKVRFDMAPVGFVSYIKITNAQNMTIGAISIGTWGMTVAFTNSSGADIPVDIEVFGHPIKSLNNEVTVRDATAYALLQNHERVLPIDNYLVQTLAAATSHANAILPIVADPTAYVDVSARGDMSLEPGDVITVTDNTNHIGATVIIPIRYEYMYDGALSCTISGMKTSARS